MIQDGAFFFFQAEAGIRGLYVTGVQTCALPISCALSARKSRWWWRRRRSPHRMPQRKSRSEERRVGKECRSRWSTYHEEKKGKLASLDGSLPTITIAASPSQGIEECM